MGTCSYCGDQFPRTRATRKYCTPRCKTNACLDRKPSRIRAAEVQALYSLLESDFASLEDLYERLRTILTPGREPLPLREGRPIVPNLD